MSKAKKITISILSVLAALMLAIDIWYLVVLISGAEKEIVNTFNVGLISTNDETGDEQYVLKVEYFSNENKNGYECLDVCLTGFTDESGKQFMSQGVQFITNTTNNDFSIDKATYTEYKESQFNFLYAKDFYEITNQFNLGNGVTAYYYQSGDNFEHDYTGSTNPLSNKDYKVTIKLDNDYYRFGLKGKVLDHEDNVDNVDWFKGYNNKFYNNFDINWFAGKIYNSIKQTSNKTTATSLFEFEDIFVWEKFDGHAYKTLGTEEMAKLKATSANYFAVQYKRVADGLRKSSDSMFKIAKGTTQLNITGDDNTSNDYMYGKTVVITNNKAFDYGIVAGNLVVFRLKDSFIQKHKDKADSIVLSVQIDLDALEDEGYEFVRFADASGLENFEIFECYKYTMKSGELLKTEIEV